MSFLISERFQWLRQPKPNLGGQLYYVLFLRNVTRGNDTIPLWMGLKGQKDCDAGFYNRLGQVVLIDVRVSGKAP